MNIPRPSLAICSSLLPSGLVESTMRPRQSIWSPLNLSLRRRRGCDGSLSHPARRRAPTDKWLLLAVMAVGLVLTSYGILLGMILATGTDPTRGASRRGEKRPLSIPGVSFVSCLDSIPLRWRIVASLPQNLLNARSRPCGRAPSAGLPGGRWTPTSSRREERRHGTGAGRSSKPVPHRQSRRNSGFPSGGTSDRLLKRDAQASLGLDRGRAPSLRTYCDGLVQGCPLPLGASRRSMREVDGPVAFVRSATLPARTDPRGGLQHTT
jgi:hypothetical protein